MHTINSNFAAWSKLGNSLFQLGHVDRIRIIGPCGNTIDLTSYDTMSIATARIAVIVVGNYITNRNRIRRRRPCGLPIIFI